MRCCGSLRDRILPWLRDYDHLQSFAVVLIYIQIACALIGSLGALFNGALLINFSIALFALVAIESSSQSLGRTYAGLLFFSILVDVSWFILFSYEIWHISSDYGALFIFSVRLTLAMQIVGFSVRLSSAFLWIQIYRLGVGYVDGGAPRLTDLDARNSFLSPATPSIARQSSGTDRADEALGGSIYDPGYYSSLFDEGQDTRQPLLVQHGVVGNNESTSSSEGSLLKQSSGWSQAIDIQHGDVGNNESSSGSEGSLLKRSSMRSRAIDGQHGVVGYNESSSGSEGSLLKQSSGRSQAIDGQQGVVGIHESSSGSEVSLLKQSSGRSRAIDEDKEIKPPDNV